VNGIVESLTAWLVEHTYAVVFVSSLVDATAFPFPGRIILAAAGAFAAAGDASLTLVIALGTAGVIITDHAWYFAGSLGSNRLLRLYCRLTFSSAALLWTAVWVGAGWLLGERWAQASSEARWVGVALAGAVALAFFGFRLWRRARATRRTGSGAPAFPGSPGVPRARPRP
jgi:membrane protein DedA with SNARE-associated domain